MLKLVLTALQVVNVIMLSRTDRVQCVVELPMGRSHSKTRKRDNCNLTRSIPL